MSSLIEIRGLTYWYRRQEKCPALQAVDLEIEPGEVVAIAGRAGSGKSTLCYALNGLIPQSFGGRMEGEVRVCGLDTRFTSVPELARHVGMVFQSAESQLVGLSIEEDTAFGLENIGLPREQVNARVLSALRMVNLHEIADRSPWTLSGGQKQRLAIAAAMAFQPEILVLDNPTAELDPVGRQEIMATLARLRSEHGLTIVIVDQELEEVLPYASRLILMDHGQIVRKGKPAEVIDQAQDLLQLGLKVPDVAHIAWQLRNQGRWKGPLPLTIDDAVHGLKHLAKARPATLTPLERHDQHGETLIELKNVSFAYPDGTPVLNRINLTIRRGEFVTLMGPNGAGKTTLAKHLNGLLLPTSGKVLVHGVDTRSSSVAKLAQKVGYVFQNPDHQIFSRTTAEEMAFGPRNLGWPKEKIAAAVRIALTRIDGKDRGEEDPFFMGLAERKLIAIASVLVMEPEVLVLDEPATGADHEAAMRIMQHLSELRGSGLTVVIVTHDVSIAANYADRIVVLRSGKIVLDGTPRETFQRSEELRSCLVTPPQVAGVAQKLGGDCSSVYRVDEMVEVFARA
jgi:energy-coupling factor transport system ATP-binding protein